ncbi:hypothetical protein HanXRQr2_Chr03g0133591 [Helianthus annuus]|uniref:Uncharacterized protein n=1 Tax=Helianthus annuus TaxID=4232 RepID=A0A9K3JJS5_HELAN|nr:hypothetical protein HanXRQr2_Chr03g0133591 [Helianthus annuus]KAJ0945635.1 hypothetical protein HanPSC8_Chr03g0130341 [Helianthus annuus]
MSISVLFRFFLLLLIYEGSECNSICEIAKAIMLYAASFIIHSDHISSLTGQTDDVLKIA